MQKINRLKWTIFFFVFKFEFIICASHAINYHNCEYSIFSSVTIRTAHSYSAHTTQHTKHYLCTHECELAGAKSCVINKLRWVRRKMVHFVWFARNSISVELDKKKRIEKSEGLRAYVDTFFDNFFFRLFFAIAIFISIAYCRNLIGMRFAIENKLKKKLNDGKSLHLNDAWASQCFLFHMMNERKKWMRHGNDDVSTIST